MQQVEDKSLEAVLVLQLFVQPSADGFVVLHHVLGCDTAPRVDLLGVHAFKQRLLGCGVADMVHPELLLKSRLPSDFAGDPALQLGAVTLSKMEELDKNQ